MISEGLESHIMNEIKLAKEKAHKDWQVNFLNEVEEFCQWANKKYVNGSEVRNVLDTAMRLYSSLPLFPIEDNDDEWLEVSPTMWAHKRRLELLKIKNDDGSIRYTDGAIVDLVDIDRFDVINSPLATDFVMKMFPIEFPYMPKKSYRVYGRVGTNKIHLMKLMTPYGRIHNIDNGCYVQDDDGNTWRNVSKKEYDKVEDRGLEEELSK